MKGNNWILWGLGALFLLFGSKAAAAKALKVLFSGASFEKSGGLIPNVKLDFDVQNVSGSVLNVKGVTGDVLINGAAVGNVSELKAQRIAAHGTSRISVTFRPSAVGIAQYLYNAFTTKLALSVRFKGTLNAEGALIPIDQTTKVL